MHERAEPPVGQQHVARFQGRVQTGKLAHLVVAQAHQGQVQDHARGQVQCSQQLDHRESAPALLRRRLRPTLLQRRRVGRGGAGGVGQDHPPAPPGRRSRGGRLNVFNTVATHALDQRGQRLQWQPGAGCAVTGRGHRPSRQMAQVGDGGVAVQHLKDE